MRTFTLVGLLSSALVIATPSAQTNAIQAATKALGADTTYSLRIVGSGSTNTVGQAYTTGAEWPRITVKNYTAWLNYDISISRVDMVREMLNPPAPGGGAAFAGEQTQNLFYSGKYAWNGFPPAPPAPDPNAAGGGRGGGAAAPAAGPAAGGGAAAPAGGGGGRGGAAGAPAAGAPAAGGGRDGGPAAGAAPGGARGGGQGAPAAGGQGGGGRAGGAPAIPAGPAPQAEAVVIERKLALWSTPQGFLRAAAANTATTRTVGRGTEVTFTVEGRHKMVGIINAANEVASVQVWVPNPVLGDMLIETTYSEYRDFNGIRFPARIVQKQGGQTALDLTITAVEKNPVVSFVIPGSVYMAPATAAPITVTSQEVTPGVFYLTGGGAHSVAINQRDHIVIVDLPTSYERGEAVIAKAKEVIPNKPVRFVINTHAHFDHSSGLRAGVAEGATIVTHESNRAYLQTALSAPRTIMADKAVGKKATVQGAGARYEMTDGTRRIQLHQITNNRHNAGWFLVYLPTEKVLIQADGFAPTAAGAAAPTAPNANAQALADTVARLKLDVGQILSLHGPRVASLADLTAVAAIGRPAAQ